MSALGEALRAAGDAAKERLDAELTGALDELRATAPALAERVAAHADRAKDYLVQGVTGLIDPEIARECAIRERDAIQSAVLEAVEVEARRKAARVGRLASTAFDLALALFTAAVRGAVR